MATKSTYELALDALSVRIDRLAKQSYKRLIGMLEAGHTPQLALQTIYLSFGKESFNAVYVAILSKAFTDLLKKPFTPQQMLDYPIGNVKLSTKLYQNATEVSKAVQKALTDHAQTFINLRKISLELYSGYNQKSVEVLKPTKLLPEYLKRAVAPFAPEVDRVTADILSKGLKTAPLRAAYQTALDKIEQGAAKKALEKALRVASYEKARYLSNRIATNELSIAYAKAQAKKLLDRPEISVVQIRPSASHVSDICDAMIDADHFGLGKGRYPAAQAPRPPFHMFCRCRAIALVNEKSPDNTQRDPDSTRAYLSSLTEEERLVVAGSKNNLQRLQNGESLGTLLNKGHTPDYQIKTLADGGLTI